MFLPLLQDLMRFWIPSTMHLTVFCKHNAYIYIGNFYMWIILKKRLIYAIEKTDTKCYKNTINIKFFYGRIKYSWPSHKEIVVYSTIWTRPLLLQSQRAQILLLLQALQDPPILMNKYWVHSFFFSLLFSWFCVLILGRFLIEVYIKHCIMLIYSYKATSMFNICI